MIIWISFMCLYSIFSLYKCQNRTFILYVVYLCKYQGSHRCDLHNRLYHYISILLGCIFCFRTSTDVFHTCNNLADLYTKDILLGLLEIWYNLLFTPSYYDWIFSNQMVTSAIFLVTKISAVINAVACQIVMDALQILTWELAN